MKTNDQEDIERELNHVLNMGNDMINLYPHIICSERATLLLAMMSAVGKTASKLMMTAATIRKNILDTLHINYIDYARRVEGMHKIWVEEVKNIPIFHNTDMKHMLLTSSDDIVQKEDTDYDLILWAWNQNRFDFLETRKGLIDNAGLMCEAIDAGLRQIGKTLRGIVDDYLKLKNDSQQQEERLKRLEKQYEEMMWEDEKKRLILEVEEYVELCGDKTKKTYQRFIDRMERKATDMAERKVLGELNGWYIRKMKPAEFIVENREKLTNEDLTLHFRFVHSRILLKNHVESLDLLLPADEKYRDLFVNRASQELAFLLAPTIATYVDFRHNYQYASIQMAMQDLGLIYPNKKNGIQMKDYINKAFLTGIEQIKDQSTLTQWTGKLLGGMFGKMDERHLQGNYSSSDFVKMKDCYWICVSIINNVVQFNLQDLRFAHYLHQCHANTPPINIYRDREGGCIMERLSIIKSVIRGETMFS